MAIIENINIGQPNDGNGDTLRNSQIKANNNFAELNNKKVEKISGKELSANDFTDADKQKLDSLQNFVATNLQSDALQEDDQQVDYIKNREAFINVIETFGKTTSNVLELFEDALFTTIIVPTSGKIYIDKLTNFQYRWSGTAYVQVGGGGGAIPTLQEVLDAGHISTKGFEIYLTNGTGIYVENVNSFAIAGQSDNYVAILGNSNTNVGIRGSSSTNIGVLAISQGNIALVAETEMNNTSNIFEAKNDGLIKSYIDKDGFVVGAGFKTPTGTAQDMLMADGTFKNLKILEDNVSVTITPPVAGLNTILKIITIPANFFEDGALYDFNCFLSNVNTIVKVYINSVPTLNGNEKVFINGSLSINSVNSSFFANLKLIGNSLKLFNNELFNLQGENSDTDFTINTANPNYLIIELSNTNIQSYTYNFSILKKTN